MLPDWYNLELVASLEFFDENTKQNWVPVTGGSNLPALNELLEPFGISYGHKVWSGTVRWAGRTFSMLSGTSILAFPEGGALFLASLTDEYLKLIQFQSVEQVVPIAASYRPSGTSGRIATLTDSSCVDDSHAHASCLAAVLDLIDYATQGLELPEKDFYKLSGPFQSEVAAKPLRMHHQTDFEAFSKVQGSRLPQCAGILLS